MTTNTNAIIDAIHEAQTGWVTADWTHECGTHPDRPDEPVYCEGGEPGTCDTCLRAARDAREASDLGELAITALRAGHEAMATGYLSQAADLERAYGDAPLWGKALELLEYC
jgi:hypothetical protein